MKLPRSAPRTVYEVFSEHEYLEAPISEPLGGRERNRSRVAAPALLLLVTAAVVGLVAALSSGRRGRPSPGSRGTVESAPRPAGSHSVAGAPADAGTAARLPMRPRRTHRRVAERGISRLGDGYGPVRRAGPAYRASGSPHGGSVEFSFESGGR